MLNPIKTILFLGFVLVVATIIFPKLSSTAKLVSVLVIYGILIGLILGSRTVINDIGLSKTTIISGFRLALPFMIAIVVGAVLLFVLKPSIFQDVRYQQELRKMLITILIVIPFYTVFLEELAFRGLLLGGLATILSPLQANIVSALAFGVWHVFSAQAFKTSIAIPQPIVILGIIFATSIAGLFFGWLRLHSGSLIAPILVHWCINSAGVVAAFFAWSNSS